VNARRERTLQEMGLAPVWRLRERQAPGAAREKAGTEPPVAEAPPAAAPASAPAPVRKPANPAPARKPAIPAPGLTVRAAASDPADDRAARILRMDWAGLKSAVRDCQACGLRKTCTQTVFGVGDEHADWLLVGEAPGAEEDARGEPFVGQAGRLLDSMLAAIDLKRGDNVYICNVLKCRPPGNRNPQPGEVAQCTPHLLRQLELIEPKLILAMGRFAVQALLATEASIASLRGRLHRYQGVPLVVTYHPAYLLRSLPDKAKAWEDLCFARRTLLAL
jgi:uracil-DNA glycosylase